MYDYLLCKFLILLMLFCVTYNHIFTNPLIQKNFNSQLLLSYLYRGFPQLVHLIILLHYRGNQNILHSMGKSTTDPQLTFLK